MRELLAERLLAEVMSWSVEDVARQRPVLQALASFKYDEYQQYSPGIGFIESLAVWLYQFDSREERQVAYEFVSSKLVFISTTEMTHLVSIAFPDYVRPLLIDAVASQTDASEHHVRRIIESIPFQVQRRRSLFLGLSEGAQIGVFRRSNPEISNEQLRLTYEIPQQRVTEMCDELKRDLAQMLEREARDDESRFNIAILLDDFSASGLSYIRKDPCGDFNGKVAKVMAQMLTVEGKLRDLVDSENLFVLILLYTATSHAKEHLRRTIREWMQNHGVHNEFLVQVIQEIPAEVSINPERDAEFSLLLEKYFDESIVDRHYKTGRHMRPHLGFDECALPLVLSHNTPNNSVPLLWYGEQHSLRGLFPRVSRHR